jgi:hypothetical protein
MFARYETRDSVNGSILDAIKTQTTNGPRFSQSKVGNFLTLHYMLAFFRFLRSLGNASVKSARDAAKASGMDNDTAKKQITADTESARDVQILKRLSPNADGFGLTPIVLTHKMENKLVSLLKQATNYTGIVTRDDLDECLSFLAEAITSKVENVTVTFEELSAAPTAILTNDNAVIDEPLVAIV